MILLDIKFDISAMNAPLPRICNKRKTKASLGHLSRIAYHTTKDYVQYFDIINSTSLPYCENTSIQSPTVQCCHILG